MRIQVLSDLHLEFGPDGLLEQIKQCNSDVLVLAGDIHTSKGIVVALENIYQTVRKHIVFIPGNHEYYFSTKQYVDEHLQECFADHEFIHVLNNAVWEHDNVVFLGSTGWWTMKDARNVVHRMSDFTVIYDLISSNYGLDWGSQSYEFFVKNLKEYDKRNIFGKNNTGKHVICVSHNAPSWQSIDKEFEGDSLNPCFANAWQHLMLSYKPDFWLHGHMHGSKEYRFDDTWIICNPYGYSGHCLNEIFDPQKTICL